MRSKRRGNREGSIYRRADGLWCASLVVGYDAAAHCKRRVVYGQTKTEVQKKLLELQAASTAGTLSQPNRMKVADYLKHWLEDVARPGVRAGTYVSYEIVLRKHINPCIGGIQLTDLQPSHVQNLYRKLEDMGVSPRTREYAHVVLRRALQQALRWNYIARNSCDAVVRPRVSHKTMRCFSPEQAKEFLEFAKADRLYALYALALFSGLRQGELFGLQWSDIDFNNGSISVQRTIYELNGRQEIGEPKTAKGRRSVQLPMIAIETLKKHRERMFTEGNHANWVFCDENGGPLRRSNFRKRSFLKILKNSDLPQLRFHDLRHTAATLLLSQGVHPKIVQERLGHSQISMTLDTYSHVLPSMQKEAASKLDNLFGT